MPPRDVPAAGAVVTRKGGDVLLVHRPKYDDWAFPKGKVDAGEHPVAAATREVAEETGLHVRLGPALSVQRYPLGQGRTKVVSYWTARVLGDDDVTGYPPNAEIDEVAWLSRAEAYERLTYDHDRATLAESDPLRRRTTALVVLRHGLARSRDGWKHDDRARPLLAGGRRQAERLVPLLAAYDVAEVHTSSSTRCVETVQPYADAIGRAPTTHDVLSEEDATTEGVVSLVDDLVDDLRDADGGLVLCTHRPVLPTVLDSLGVPEPDAVPELDKGEMLVVHLRKTRIVATERHHP